MKAIIDNLTRQHKELTKVTMSLVQLLDVEPLSADATEVRRHLRTLTGILSVHVSMEDRSFYPFLLEHRNLELRNVARQFLAQRDEIKEAYADYSRRWSEGRAIEVAAARFIEETRDILLKLGKRMIQEDHHFHPRIVKEWEEKA